MDLPAWHPHPDVWVLLGATWGGYLWLWRKRSETVPAELDPERKRRKRLFALGMIALIVASDYPIHDLSESALYSFHMIQHMLFTFLAVPLLFAGIPAWMWRGLLRPRPIHAVARRVLRPIPAFFTYTAVLLFTHWPAVVNLSTRSELFHFTAHLLVVLSSFVLWWPILSPLPELPAASPPIQMVYLFLQSVAPTIPASFLTFGDHPLYTAYVDFPRLWGISALSDMRTAGLIMKIGGGLILWGWIAVIFFRWYDAEQRQEGWDPLRVHTVETDVRTGLSKS